MPPPKTPKELTTKYVPGTTQISIKIRGELAPPPPPPLLLYIKAQRGFKDYFHLYVNALVCYST